tara:strand:+ start:575 stop:712 length:138 start_codon:yes stop_codon:yes gene_type:complete
MLSIEKSLDLYLEHCPERFFIIIAFALKLKKIIVSVVISSFMIAP